VELDERQADERQRQSAQDRIARNPQRGQLGEVSKVGGQLARQAIVRQVERHDPTEGVGCHSVPFSERRSLEPAAGMCPVLTPRASVQVFEYRRIRLVAVRACIKILNALQPSHEIGDARSTQARGHFKMEMFQSIQLEKALGNSARQLTVAKTQPLELAELSEFRRDHARKGVRVKIHLLQAREVADLGRDRAHQSIVGEIQSDNLAMSVHIDPVPILKRCGGQPVVSIGPARTVGCTVESFQRRPLGNRHRHRYQCRSRLPIRSRHRDAVGCRDFRRHFPCA